MKKLKPMEEITIKIFRSSGSNGYYYSIYDASDDLDNVDEIDGGFCTSDLTNALEMATDEALSIVVANRDDCNKQDLAKYNSLSKADKDKVNQMIVTMKESEASDNEGWDGTDAQYLSWALEFLFPDQD